MSPILLLVVFAVELFIVIVNAVGAATINGLLWSALNRLPLESSKLAGETRKLQKEYLKIRLELNATSSQDEFAKWAKLRRQHDKALEKLEKNKQAMTASKAKFDTYVNAIRILLTRAPHYAIPFWYSKEPMFWLPRELFPYYAEWFLSLPKAPLGSVSIMSWQLACTAIIKLLTEALAAIYALVVISKSKEKEQVKVPGRTAPAESQQSEKKEL
ncbi:related to Protein GET1 [Cephalotrichum gorgonifer]|uniref:Related to Protein GET1 n=1 Tax=Cephalotrichum gorgonifer TaxID=2041049 RepID=A0AAE8SW48_9PEZI|nr:related to Protein GET1 [Cephalotrichum gorgonifer]